MSDRKLRKSTIDTSERRQQRKEANKKLSNKIKERRAAHHEVIAEFDAQIYESESCFKFKPNK